MVDNGFTLTGKLYRVFDTDIKPYGDKTFYTRKFIIQIHEEYNGNDYYQYIPCELRGENKCAIIDRFEEGWNIKIHCNMRGVKYNPKDDNGQKDMTKENYFSSVDVWKIENMNAAPPQGQQQSQQTQPSFYGEQPNNNAGGNSSSNFNPSPETIDDLPF